MGIPEDLSESYIYVLSSIPQKSPSKWLRIFNNCRKKDINVTKWVSETLMKPHLNWTFMSLLALFMTFGLLLTTFMSLLGAFLPYSVAHLNCSVRKATFDQIMQHSAFELGYGTRAAST